MTAIGSIVLLGFGGPASKIVTLGFGAMDSGVAAGPAFFASTSAPAQPDGSSAADPMRSTSEPA